MEPINFQIQTTVIDKQLMYFAYLTIVQNTGADHVKVMGVLKENEWRNKKLAPLGIECLSTHQIRFMQIERCISAFFIDKRYGDVEKIGSCKVSLFDTFIEALEESELFIEEFLKDSSEAVFPADIELGVCNTCGSENGSKECNVVCPYQSDIHGNNEPYCNCCEKCQNNCALEC